MTKTGVLLLIVYIVITIATHNLTYRMGREKAMNVYMDEYTPIILEMGYNRGYNDGLERCKEILNGDMDMNYEPEEEESITNKIDI
jgi:hypothetical protein